MSFRVQLVVAAALLAAPPALSATVPYALNTDAEFSKGCYPPCACPLLFAPLGGTLSLEKTGSNPLFVTYAVEAVAFTVALGGTTIDISGKGTYTIGGEVALLQRMELDLVVGDDPTTHYDSGMVPVTTPFPALDVTVSRNGMFCFDTVLHIAADPTGPSADLGGDGIVGGGDLGAMLGQWGPCMPPGGACPADLDGDGTVGPKDLGILLASWNSDG
ncbi:MAG: hypothetical protein U0575_11270 [Phycisphaerales bacterium]